MELKNEVHRKARVEGDRIVMSSSAEEVITPQTFMQSYYQHQAELNSMQQQLESLKDQLSEIIVVEPDEELKKFVEMLKKAEKIAKKDEIIRKLKILEKRIASKRDELGELTPTVLQLQKR